MHEEMCVLLQHGSRPHWRSVPELMHSRRRVHVRSVLLNSLSLFHEPLLLPAFYNSSCLMNFLSVQPTDAVIWENLGPTTAEPAVQEEEGNRACVNGTQCFGHDVRTFWFQLRRGGSFPLKVWALSLLSNWRPIQPLVMLPCLFIVCRILAFIFILTNNNNIDFIYNCDELSLSLQSLIFHWICKKLLIHENTGMHCTVYYTLNEILCKYKSLKFTLSWCSSAS